MFHDQRRWALANLDDPHELADWLCNRCGCACSGFRHRGYLYLNDSTGGDGIVEYAIVKELPDGTFVQVESITFGWCDYAKTRGYIESIAAGEFDAVMNTPVTPKIDEPGTHVPCRHCR